MQSYTYNGQHYIEATYPTPSWSPQDHDTDELGNQTLPPNIDQSNNNSRQSRTAPTATTQRINQTASDRPPSFDAPLDLYYGHTWPHSPAQTTAASNQQRQNPHITNTTTIPPQTYIYPHTQVTNTAELPTQIRQTSQWNSHPYLATPTVLHNQHSEAYGMYKTTQPVAAGNSSKAGGQVRGTLTQDPKYIPTGVMPQYAISPDLSQLLRAIGEQNQIHMKIFHIHMESFRQVEKMNAMLVTTMKALSIENSRQSEQMNAMTNARIASLTQRFDHLLAEFTKQRTDAAGTMNANTCTTNGISQSSYSANLDRNANHNATDTFNSNIHTDHNTLDVAEISNMTYS